MRTHSSFLLFLLSVTYFVIGCFSAAALDDKNAPTSLNIGRKVKGSSNNIQESPTIPGAYIVRLKDKTSAAKTKTTAVSTATMMQTLKQQLIANGTIQVTTNDVVNVRTDRIYTKSIRAFLITGVPEVMLSSLLQTPGVTSVEPDRTVTGTSAVKSGSTTAKDQPGNQGIREMQQTAQETPWGVSRVGGPIDINTVPNPNAKIFVLDSGISTKTNDLNIDKTMSINFVGVDQGASPAAWEDLHGHGTHVTGIIAAKNNGINVVGVVPGASVVAVRVLDETNSGRLSDIIAGVEYVNISGKKGDVANMSLGGTLFYPSALNGAVESTASLGIKFAIAAGNDSTVATFESPASSTGVNIYTVSCYDQTDTLCSFSNFGKVVDVGGPGQDILSLSKGGGVETRNGTSMSAPHIAGLLFANSIRTDGFVNGDKDAYPDPIAVYAGDIPTPAPTPASNNLLFFILPDFYSGTETSWALIRNSPGPPVVVASVGQGTYPYINPDDGYLTTVSNLPIGSYRFDLYDSASDGLFPPAHYILSLGNGKVLKSGGSFKNMDTTFFTITSSSFSLQDVTAKTNKSAVAASPTTVVVPAPQPVTKAQKPKKK